VNVITASNGANALSSAGDNVLRTLSTLLATPSRAEAAAVLVASTALVADMATLSTTLLSALSVRSSMVSSFESASAATPNEIHDCKQDDGAQKGNSKASDAEVVLVDGAGTEQR
jgi:hypothetical protein